MSGEPIRRSEAPYVEPIEALCSEIHGVCDLLVLKPLPNRSTLRSRCVSALSACELADETGLAAHLLRNLLRDLASRSGPIDASYYAVHLSRAVSRLGG